MTDQDNNPAQPGSDSPSGAQTPAGADSSDPSPTLNVIDRFGGIRPMAAKLDVPVTTVQGWKKRDAIPEPRHAEILKAAAAHNIALTPEDIARTAPAEHATPEEGADEDGPTATDKAIEVKAKVAAELGEKPPTIGGTASETDDGFRWSEMASPDPAADDQGAKPDPGSSMKTGTETAAGHQPPAAKSSPTGRTVPPSQTPPPAPQKQAGGTALLALFIAVLTIIGMVLQPLWLPQVQAEFGIGNGGAPRSVDMEERLLSLEDRLAELTRSVSQLPGRDTMTAIAQDVVDASSGQEDMAGRLDQIELRLDGLAQALAAGGGSGGAEIAAALEDRLQEQSATIATLTSEIDRLSEAAATPGGIGGAEAAFVLAVGNLQSAIRAGSSYERELDAVLALRGATATDNGTGQSGGLQTLTQFAGRGIATSGDLAVRLDGLVGEALRAANTPLNPTVLQQIGGTLASLVTVRRKAGEVEGTGNAERLARAQAHANGGNIEAAISEVERLNESALVVLDGWLRAARDHVAAMAAAQSLLEEAAGIAANSQ